MQTLFSYPNIDPIAFSIGPLDIRWYGISYVVGILCAWGLARKHITKFPTQVTHKDFDDFLTYAILGIVIGGRLGYILFYNLGHFIQHPIDIVKTWEGGMAFHGGLIGVILAIFFFCKRRQIKFLSILDIAGAITPIGLFFGRIANFINAEHFGRITDSSLGIVFPTGGPLPRHASQLYEAGLEGVALLAITTLALYKQPKSIGTGFVSGVFLVGYSIARSISEFFREPELFLALEPLTYGQLLSAPMLLIGIYFINTSKKRMPS